MDRPNSTFPNSPGTTASPMPVYLPDPSIKGLSFDQLLQNRGIRFIHKRAVPCPNLKTIDNNAHIPECVFCNNSGMMYYGEREIVGVFSGNNLEKTFEMHGVWEYGQAVVTLPAEYDTGEQADFNTFDRLIVKDFTVRLWELKEYEPRPGGQSLRYPVQKIDFASSIVNGVQKFYYEGADFCIDSDGKIVWLSGREPTYDNVNEKGETIAFSYYAYPEYIVMQTLRELRVTQEVIDGQKVARRLPQQVLVKREFLVNQSEKIL